MVNKVICGNSAEELKKIPSNSVDCIVTSPPYWQKIKYDGLPDFIYNDNNCKHDFAKIRTSNPNGSGGKNNKYSAKLYFKGRENGLELTSYNDRATYSNQCKKCGAWKGQLGLEPTFQQYLNNLITFFDEAQRILKPTGTCWVNMGDTYGGSGNGTNDYSPEGKHLNNRGKQAKKLKTNGGARSAPRKQLLLIPHRFAIMMQDRGWILRNDIIWAKRNAMPESVKDRFTKKHEYLFFFTKSPKYYFDLDAIREEHSEVSKKRNKYPNLSKGYYGKSVKQENSLNKYGKNPGTLTDFWDIPNKGKKDMHFATYSQTLVARPILAGCPKGGVVLDFFAGTGTTGVAAKNLGRNYILIEGSKKYCAMATKNLKTNKMDSSLSGLGAKNFNKYFKKKSWKTFNREMNKAMKEMEKERKLVSRIEYNMQKLQNITI